MLNLWELFPGPNAAYVEEVLERFRRDPDGVSPEERAVLERLDTAGGPGAAPAAGAPTAQVIGAERLAWAIRSFGHLAARLDPLGTPPRGDPELEASAHGVDEKALQALPASVVMGERDGSALDAIRHLREVYCGTLGYDFGHVHAYEEREWLRRTAESGAALAKLDAAKRRALLRRLTEVEGFETFLHRTFVGQKRFSIEGTDVLVPMLDELIRDAIESRAKQVVIGMAHRGRLNVLAHILGKPYGAILEEFHLGQAHEAQVDVNFGWTGDVKYHLGRHRTIKNGGTLEVTLANNPSHLEFVNPVAQGMTRAVQEDRAEPGLPKLDPSSAICVTIHGDAAFPGEGIVAETLNLSRLAGYRTGGTVHVILNNQLGFTTEPEEGRSTLYASDLAKGFEIPIIHVNADDPEACLAAMRIAHDYRRTFGKDFLIDVVGYRRFGHNEGDEPSFTQPRMYDAITRHPTVRALYAERLEGEGVVSPDDARAFETEVEGELRAAYEAVMSGKTELEVPGEAEALDDDFVPGKVAEAELRSWNEALLARPDGFEGNAKLERLIGRRREALDRPGAIDWGHAEALAFAAILSEGTPVRLSGQDTVRGTFSHRHLGLHDIRTGDVYVPLEHIPSARASFAVLNSPLSEAAAMGFEYGYTLGAPSALVLWEAQFGDFANSAQVIIDQFIASARAKWRDRSGIVLLLPHAYEGQGPEHSSARLERYLQLAAEDNIRVANVTTAAQYFHLLRLQAASLRRRPRPLVLMTPKSLLRNAQAQSSLQDLVEGTFHPVLDDPQGRENPKAVERLVLASGKVAVEVARAKEKNRRVALARVERLYPFPAEEIRSVVAGYPGLREVVWAQEEPKNMGAWQFVAPRLRAILGEGLAPVYVGRPDRAAPAEGMADVHTNEEGRIVDRAVDSGPVHARSKRRGG